MIKRLFWHPDYHRPTMIPRIVLQSAILVALFVPLRAVARPARPWLIALVHDIPRSEALRLLSNDHFWDISTVLNSFYELASLLLFVGVFLIGARLVDRRRFSDFTGKMDRDWWIDLAAGMLIGGSVQTVVFLVGWLAGWVRISGVFSAGLDGTSFGFGLVALLVFFVSAAILEELLLRGYAIRTFSEGFTGLGPRWAISLAVILASLAFGFGHATNPGITVAIQLGIVLGGIWMAAGYILTGRLALPVGMHFAWNFAQMFFGFPVSGIDFGVSIITTETLTYNLWIGNRLFGPESGLLSLFAVLIGAALMLAYIKQRYGRFRLRDELVTPTLLPRRGEAHR